MEKSVTFRYDIIFNTDFTPNARFERYKKDIFIYVQNFYFYFIFLKTLLDNVSLADRYSEPKGKESNSD